MTGSASRAGDVLVVGGGAVGIAVAHELARGGARVTVLEREAGPGLACSYGSAGLVVPSHCVPLATPEAVRSGLRWMLRRDSPFKVRPRASAGLARWLAEFARAARPARVERGLAALRELSLQSLALHRALAGEIAGGTTFRQQGCLNAYETEALFAAGRAEAEQVAAPGLEPEVVPRERLRELEPALGDALAGGIRYRCDGHLDSHAFVRALAAAAARRGAEIVTGCEVLGLGTGAGGVRAATTRGDFRAGALVLAAGSWTPGLARQLGARLPVEAAKGYSVDLEDGGHTLRAPVYLQGAKVVMTPLEGRLRLAGTLELDGLRMRVDRRRVEAVRAAGIAAVPALGERRVLGIWRGLRPASPDGLPLIGPLPGRPNVVAATGHGMLGLTLAPVTGRLVAEHLAGREPSLDLAPFDPGRFGGLRRAAGLPAPQ